MKLKDYVNQEFKDHPYFDYEDFEDWLIKNITHDLSHGLGIVGTDKSVKALILYLIYKTEPEREISI